VRETPLLAPSLLSLEGVTAPPVLLAELVPVLDEPVLPEAEAVLCVPLVPVAEAVDALADAPKLAVLELASPNAVVTMVTGMKATSVEESVVVTAVVVTEVSNEDAAAEMSVAIKPAGPT